MTDSLSDIRIVTRGGHPDFLDLPWGEPLEHWKTKRLVKMAHGVSRHIVRFVRYDDRVYALKETEVEVAFREYYILRDLHEEHLPVVEPVGVVTTGSDGRAILMTRYLDFSLPYWYILGRDEPALADCLINSAVVLLVRLHLDRCFWGDCSLSNILFRRDAGAMMAYLVDAETTERKDTLSDGMRNYDVELAQENIIGGLLNLQEANRVPPDIDPFEIASELVDRYAQLWDELTRTEAFDYDERWRIERRIRQINDLGFDVEELSIDRNGSELAIKPILIEEGHHARELRRRTGLEVQENQARRLLADIESHRAWLEAESGKSTPAAVAAARWLANIYEPLVESVPESLLARLEPAEIFHHLLEHRYFLSERADREVSHEDSLADYLVTVLAEQPSERQLEVTADIGSGDANPGELGQG